MISEISTPIGSVARSGRPVLEMTDSTSGKEPTAFSIKLAELVELDSDTLGIRIAWMAIAPSSSSGRHTAPRRVAANTAASNGKAATKPIALGWTRPQSSIFS